MGFNQDVQKFKRIYDQQLGEIKKLMIKFISAMDIHEVYQFANLFNFLIDKEALKELILQEEREAFMYEI